MIRNHRETENISKPYTLPEPETESLTESWSAISDTCVYVYI